MPRWKKYSTTTPMSHPQVLSRKFEAEDCMYCGMLTGRKQD